MRLLLALAAFVMGAAQGAVLGVGPGKPYDKPCAAIRAAAPGDTIEIDASGDYTGDVCQWTTNELTIRGVNGRPKIDAAGRNVQGKGTWVITGNDTVIDNVELTGAAVPDRNGAAIRQEGRNLTVRNAYLHHNENGILAGDSAGSEIVLEYSQFADNGSGDGFTHNIYVNHIARFTMRFCDSRRAVVGHLVKSRAAENHILYNMFLDEAEGTSSYEIDLPNGGLSYVMGNVVQQGPRTGNSTMLAYREEGAHALNPDSSLFVIHNTFVNDRSAGTFLGISASTPTPAVVRNNIFHGRGTVNLQTGAVMENNLTGQDARFKDLERYDYKLLPDSPALGAAPAEISPRAQFQYVPVACGEPRGHDGNLGALGTAPLMSLTQGLPARCHQIFSVTNAASRTPGPVAPGSLVAISGSNLVYGTVIFDPLRPRERSGDVTVNGQLAPSVLGLPGVAVQVPYEAKPGAASLTITIFGEETAPFPFEIVEAAPAIFVDTEGRALAQYAEGAITVFLTGIGAVQPQIATGDAAPDDPAITPILSASATIAGQPAELKFLSLVPGTVGVAKVEIVMPELPDGDYELILTVGTASSPPTLLRIQH